jgi:hypothetical protein
MTQFHLQKKEITLMALQQAGKSEVLETGDIYFFYRPKVEQDQPKGVKDLERFYLVLSPKGKKVYRMIIVGQKVMPNVHETGERSWGFVDLVAKDATEIQKALRETHYETKTRGERELPAARPAGEGVYAIVRHGDHTHLAYSLELPRQPDKVQRDLRIAEEGSYIITVKNPETAAPKGVGLRNEEQARFPRKLQEVFRGRKFIDCDPPDFLDYEGTELILIAAKEDPGKELGIKLETENETDKSADIFSDLKLKRSEHPVKPLFEGKWE